MLKAGCKPLEIKDIAIDLSRSKLLESPLVQSHTQLFNEAARKKFKDYYSIKVQYGESRVIEENSSYSVVAQIISTKEIPESLKFWTRYKCH